MGRLTWFQSTQIPTNTFKSAEAEFLTCYFDGENAALYDFLDTDFDLDFILNRNEDEFRIQPNFGSFSDLYDEDNDAAEKICAILQVQDLREIDTDFRCGLIEATRILKEFMKIGVLPNPIEIIDAEHIRLNLSHFDGERIPLLRDEMFHALTENTGSMIAILQAELPSNDNSNAGLKIWIIEEGKLLRENFEFDELSNNASNDIPSADEILSFYIKAKKIVSKRSQM